MLALMPVAPTWAAEYETQNVALVIIDGLRYSEGLGDPDHTQVPEMWALAQQGTIIEPFFNDGYTYTARAIPAIWAGAWTPVDEFPDPDCGGDTNNHSRLPTVFEYYRKGLARPAEDCFNIVGNVSCPWKPSFDAEYGPDFWPTIHHEGSTDTGVWTSALHLLNEQTPRFFVLYLSGVDHGGHSGDWDEYLESISEADSVVGYLWHFLQIHPHYAGTTTMIVTNDHGRHDNDFSGHGDGCDGCRRIQLLAVGPDTPAGLVSTVPRSIPDITPTIGELLGFPTGYSTGTPMLEILGQEAKHTSWMDTAAHSAGNFGSFWRTDVSVRNTSTSPAEVELRLHSNGETLNLEHTVSAGAQTTFEDIVGLLGHNGAGSLQIVSTERLMVTGRTYTQDEAGTFGQHVEAYRPEETLRNGDTAWLMQLRQEEGRFRTNLSFTNTGEATARVEVDLYDESGVLLHSYAIDLEAFELVQDLAPFSRRAQQANLGFGFARVTVVEGNFVLVSASVVDSVTNDATTIPFEKD